MYLDYLQYQNFYNSTIGNSISSFLELKLKKYCFLYENQNVGCFGFSHPHTKFIKNYSSKSINCYSKKVGISNNNLTQNNILIDEEKIPFEDSYFDHVFLIHYLENTQNIKLCLREIWRTLAPEGKAYLLIPNKKSSWYLSDKSPFSTGLGFSKKQINNILNDSFFETQLIDRLIYFPNLNFGLIDKNKFLIEKFGSIFFRYFNGVFLCVMKKRLYANINNRQFEKSSLVKKIVKGL